MAKEKTIAGIFKNAKRTLSIAWQADKKLFIFLFFLNSILSIFPIALSYIYKLLLDEIVKSQNTIGIVSLTLLSLESNNFFF